MTSILEGTLRRSGDRLRITAQLIDAVSGYQLWSERYDRVLEDIFDVQDEIALAVVDALKLKLFGDAKEAVVKRYTDDAEVHELFLKGRYYSYKYTEEGWTRAVEFFEKVIEKQPDHAAAYAGKAAALGCLWFFGLSPTAMFLGFADRFDDAMALARRALAGSMVDRQQTVGHGINSAKSGNEISTETR